MGMTIVPMLSLFNSLWSRTGSIQELTSISTKWEVLGSFVSRCHGKGMMADELYIASLLWDLWLFLLHIRASLFRGIRNSYNMLLVSSSFYSFLEHRTGTEASSAKVGVLRTLVGQAEVHCVAAKDSESCPWDPHPRAHLWGGDSPPSPQDPAGAGWRTGCRMTLRLAVMGTVGDGVSGAFTTLRNTPVSSGLGTLKASHTLGVFLRKAGPRGLRIRKVPEVCCWELSTQRIELENVNIAEFHRWGDILAELLPKIRSPCSTE